jgi:hypothetical protein
MMNMQSTAVKIDSVSDEPSSNNNLHKLPLLIIRDGGNPAAGRQQEPTRPGRARITPQF